MRGSAPWKTEKMIVGLPRLLVLSVFSRFGVCHLSPSPEPYPRPRPSSIIGPPNAAGNDTAGIGLDVASQPACGKAGRLAQATPAHRPGARSGPPASRAASLASAPRPGPEGPALAPRDCVAYHNPATRPMQKSTKATDPTHNATKIAYSTAIIRQPPEPPQPAHHLTTHSPHRPFHARN
jgi:hypothetical protein